jgi:hypothetical protein
MKKLLLFSMIAMMGITASAADMTQEAFLAKKKAQAEAAGTTFNEAGALAYFKKVDTNKDGLISPAEQKAFEAQKMAAPKKAAE